MQWRYSEGRRAKVVLFVLMFILGNIIYLIEPYIIGKIFELIQLNSTSPDFLWTFFSLISLLFLTNLGFWMFHGPARVMENNNAYLIQRDYQMRLFSYVLALPASWHRDHHSGDTIDKINRASKGLESFSSHNFLVIEMVMRLVGSAAALFLLDRAIGSFVFIISLLTLVCIRRFDKILYQQYIKLYRMFGFIAAGVYEYISNIFTVITLRLPERAKKEIGAQQEKAMAEIKREAGSIAIAIAEKVLGEEISETNPLFAVGHNSV